jgi:hypothetical protein
MLADRRAEAMSGAGFPVDQTLREFVDSANDRYLEHGRDGLPLSYVVTERFCRHDAAIGLCFLRPERDHLFDFMDFLTYAASDAPPDADRLAATIPDGVVLNFTPVGPWAEEATVIERDGAKMAFCGVSMVRSRSEVAFCAVLGPVCDLGEAGRKLSASLGGESIQTQSFNPAADSSKFSLAEMVPAAVEGEGSIWRNVLFMLADLKTRKLRGRYLYVDVTKNYMVHSDDPDILPDGEWRDGDTLPKALENALEELGARRNVIGVCLSALLLPSYFAYRRPEVVARPRETELGRRRAEPEVRKLLPAASGRVKSLLRQVAALERRPAPEPMEAEAGRARSYTPPDYQVEVDGFWRRLKYADHYGKGPEGEAVQGWTWVRGHQRWRDRPAAPQAVLLKKPLAAGLG